MSNGALKPIAAVSCSGVCALSAALQARPAAVFRQVGTPLPLQEISIVIDDYDSIEEDLAVFSSYTPDDLRLRTATVLATHQGVGGVRIRDGSADALGDVSDEQKWIIDGATSMIKQFAEFLPDMDLVFNLGDEPRVAVPFNRLQEALSNPQRYPAPEPSPCPS